MFIGLNGAREHFFYRSLFIYLLLRKSNASKDTSSNRASTVDENCGCKKGIVRSWIQLKLKLEISSLDS